MKTSDKKHIIGACYGIWVFATFAWPAVEVFAYGKTYWILVMVFHILTIPLARKMMRKLE